MVIPIIGRSLPPADELRVLSYRMIRYAIANPSRRPVDDLDPLLHHAMVALRFKVGLSMHLFNETVQGEEWGPKWLGSVTALIEIGSGTDYNFGVPEEAIINQGQWDAEDSKIAGEILGEIMRPLILERTQPISVRPGLFGIHWLTPVQVKDGRISYERDKDHNEEPHRTA